MQISNIHIKNFRGISDLSIDLDDFVVLIGENNAGKSTILDAIKCCLSSKHVFEEYDYHLENDIDIPSDAKPIEIIITFTEREVGEWPNEISQILDKIVQPDDQNDLKKIILRVHSEHDSIEPQSNTKWEFLNIKGAPLEISNFHVYLANLNKVTPIFYLPSIRDAKHEFKPSSQFWKHFIQPQEIKPEDYSDIEEKLKSINDEMLKLQSDFSDVEVQLQEISKIVDIANRDDAVSIETVPSKISDVLKNARVHILSKAGAMIPLIKHGQGTQSISILLLFKKFVEEKLKIANYNSTQPILLMEEPEAHLHPSACSSIADTLSKEMTEIQKIITTHSGDFLASVNLHSIRKISCKNGETYAHRIKLGDIDDDALYKMDFRIKHTRGSLLFARCWLLVEGPTECILLPEFARLLDKDLLANGVHCIDFAQLGLANLIKIADALSINWVLFTDNDPQGQKYQNTASKFLNSIQCQEYIFHTNDDDIETLLLNNKFSAIYNEYFQKGKPDKMKIEKAIEVVKYIQQNNINVPPPLVDVINKAYEFGRGV